MPPNIRLFCIDHMRFSASKPKKQFAELIGHQHKEDIQCRYDQHVQQLCNSVAQSPLEREPNGLQNGNVAGIVVGVVGLQQLSHGSGNNAKSYGKCYDGFVFAGWLGPVQFQCRDQQESQHHQIVKGHGMEGHIVPEIFLNISRTVDQIWIDQHQKEQGSADGGGDGTDLLSMFAPVESHCRNHEQVQRTKMEGKMV